MDLQREDARPTRTSVASTTTVGRGASAATESRTRPSISIRTAWGWTGSGLATRSASAPSVTPAARSPAVPAAISSRLSQTAAGTRVW